MTPETRVLVQYRLDRSREALAEAVLLLWVLVFPLGYYFLSFPRASPIFTFDRGLAVLLAIAICLHPRNKLTPLPVGFRRSAWAWAAFLAAGTVSMVHGQELHGPMRMLLEAFLFPAILGYYVIACFPVRRYVRVLHCTICVVALYSAAIGVAEVVLGTDLLPLPGAGEYLAGQQEGLALLRVNGPFLTNHSFGLIGLVTLCLLGFLQRSAGNSFPRWQRLLHGLGMTAALVQALLPLFRSIFITLAVIIFLRLFHSQSMRRRLAGVAALTALVAILLAARSLAPDLYEERVSSSDNVYGRIAQQGQNYRVFLEHPLIGVGLNNFNQVASRTPRVGVSYEGVQSLDYPHSNLGAVLAETGLLGFLSYLLSQIFLVLAFWKLREGCTPSGSIAWSFFLYIYLGYWITGLALTSGYYADLNLWFVFSIGLVYKYAIQEQEAGRATANSPLDPLGEKGAELTVAGI